MSSLRGELADARTAAITCATTADEAAQRLHRAEERAAAVAEEARLAAISATEKIDVAKEATAGADPIAEEVRVASEKLREAEQKAG